GLLIQRFSLVEAPEADSLQFLAAARARALAANDVALATAAQYALGAATGGLAARDPATASRYNRELVAALEDAHTPEEREGALRSLGNAGLDENVPIVLAATRDADDSVRAAAASALRKTVSVETTSALLGLATDPATGVGTEALSALSERALGDAPLAQLEQL